jgi:hypothetical protein
VGPRTCQDKVERSKILHLPGLKLRPLGRSARCQSIYRLLCPGSRGIIRVSAILYIWSIWALREMRSTGRNGKT